MTAPPWPHRFARRVIDAIRAELPKDLDETAYLIAREVAAFHAEQQPMELLDAVAAIAALCANTEDGRIVTKPGVSPVDFMRHVREMIFESVNDITWRVAFTEKTAALEEALAVARTDVTALRRQLRERDDELVDLFLRTEGYRHLIDRVFLEDRDPQATIPERAALYAEVEGAVRYDGRVGPVPRLLDALRIARRARHAWRVHSAACPTCSTYYDREDDSLCDEGAGLMMALQRAGEATDDALDGYDPSLATMRR